MVTPTISRFSGREIKKKNTLNYKHQYVSHNSYSDFLSDTFKLIFVVARHLEEMEGEL